MRKFNFHNDYESREVKRNKALDNNGMSIPEIIKEELKQVMGGGKELDGDTQKRFDKVVDTIKERDHFPGVYEFMPSAGLMLGERNDLIDRLETHDHLQFNFGAAFIVAEKD